MKTVIVKRGYKRHPWPRWFAQKSFTLRRGRDYHQGSYSMAQGVRNVAAKRGYAVSIAISDDSIEVEVTKKGRK